MRLLLVFLNKLARTNIVEEQSDQGLHCFLFPAFSLQGITLHIFRERFGGYTCYNLQTSKTYEQNL